MNVGASNRREVVAAAVLGAAAIVLFAHMLLTRGSAPAAAAPPAAAAGQARLVRQIRRGPAAGGNPLQPSLDPSLKVELLKASEDVEYHGTGRNIFTAEAALPPIPKPVDCAFKDKTKCGPKPEIAQGPPPPPPIPLKFYGFATSMGQPKKIFLASGDDVFVAGEGDIVDRRYRVVRISPNAVLIQDMLSNNQQSIPLSG